MGIRTGKVSPIFSFLTAPWRTLKPNAPESEEYGISNNLWNTSVKFLTAAMNRGDLLLLDNLLYPCVNARQGKTGAEKALCCGTVALAGTDAERLTCRTVATAGAGAKVSHAVTSGRCRLAAAWHLY
jgi:hypothetical protein